MKVGLDLGNYGEAEKDLKVENYGLDLANYGHLKMCYLVPYLKSQRKRTGN